MTTIVSPIRVIVLVALAIRAASAAEYPGPVPGPAQVRSANSHTTLSNEAIGALWDTREGSLRLERVTAPHEPEAGAVFGGELFFVVLRGGQRVAASEMGRTPVDVVRLSGDAEAARAEARLGGYRIAATFTSPSPAFTVAWSAELRDGGKRGWGQTGTPSFETAGNRETLRVWG